jgi:hypothetical protein
LGEVHNFTLGGFVAGAISAAYALGWIKGDMPLQPVIFICTVSVFVATVVPIFVLFEWIQPAPSGKWWGAFNGFSIAVALLAMIAAGGNVF